MKKISPEQFSSKKSCIYKPLASYISFARIFGGFPLKYVDENDQHCFQFTRSSYINSMAIIALACLLYSGQVMVAYSNSVSSWNLSEEMRQAGLTTTDTVAMVGLWIPHILAFFTLFFFLKRSAERLSKLSGMISKLRHIEITNDDISLLIRRTHLRTIAFTILGVFACLLSGHIDGLVLKDKLQSKLWFYLIKTLKALMTAIILLSPTSTVTSMMVDHTLGVVRLVVRRYSDNVLALAELDEGVTLREGGQLQSGGDHGHVKCPGQTGNGDMSPSQVDREAYVNYPGDSVNPVDLGHQSSPGHAGHSGHNGHADQWKEHFIDTGLYVSDLIELTDRTIGPLIFTSLSVSFATEVFGGFFGIMMVTAFREGGGFNVLEFLFGLFFAILGCMSLINFMLVSLKGQSVTNFCKRSRKALETIIYKKKVGLSEEDLVKVGILLKRWSKPAALRPMDAFDVGRAMGLSVYGLLATYIIVLVQFKVGECKV